MCVTDPIWQDFLEHLCYGHMQEKHIQMLHRLVLRRAGSESVNFKSELWNSGSIVTPRHAGQRLELRVPNLLGNRLFCTASSHFMFRHRQCVETVGQLFTDHEIEFL